MGIDTSNKDYSKIVEISDKGTQPVDGETPDPMDSVILIMNEYSVLKSEINTLEAIPHY